MMIDNKKNIIKATLFSAILLVLCTLTNVAFSANNGQELEDGIYTIKSALNEQYVLDIEASSQKDGGNLELWNNGNTDNQRFILKYLGDGTYSIVALHSKKAIDVEEGRKEKGTNILQWGYHGGNNQRWIIKSTGNGNFNIISKGNGLYLDIPNSKAGNGSNVQVWTQNGAKNQEFKFVKQDDNKGTKTINNGIYLIESSTDTSKTLEIPRSSLVTGEKLGVWNKNSTVNQKFEFTYRDNGYYTISAVHSDKYLDISEGSKNDGAEVIQWNYHGGNNQQWKIQDAGNGYFNIISRCNGLYLTIDGTSVKTCKENTSLIQKFKLEKPGTTITGEKTIEDGRYIIASKVNTSYVIDIPASSTKNGEIIEIWRNRLTDNQRFDVKYLGNGYYTIKAVHSGKALEVPNNAMKIGTKITQNADNTSDSQQWIIKKAEGEYYYIISKSSELYMEIDKQEAKPGVNLQIQNHTGYDMQKFKFCNPNTLIDIDDNKYPGYKESLENLKLAHPNWNFKFLYTGLNFSDAVSGEYEVRSANLVPTSYGGEWISGTALYDTGWYGASEKAIARFMDPRNFLNEVDVFQFQDVNDYLYGVCTLEGIQEQVNNSFLKDYATDIDTACRNENVNPYYIIARLFQENGRNPSNGTYKMNGGDGKYYYNPFNIGATGNSKSEVYNNALARAKREGWDTMVKALQGGIYFCKKNWLENYQNTLYQNKFDIDSTNGTSLYSHQYMQNLFGAYNEAKSLQGMYDKTGRLDSDFTFIIPLYENMPKDISPEPKNNQESYIINVKTTGTEIRIRKEASTDSEILREIADKGTVLLSVQRGINSNWHKVVTKDGLIGYVSGAWLEQVDDVKTCNYSASVKTNDGKGCYIRIGPSTRLDMAGSGLSDGTYVTVIDDSTYKNIDGYDWSRIMLSNGRQAFMPSRYLTR
ncbi:MAG: RICIN domain-containing protein [Clostridia bacterium]